MRESSSYLQKCKGNINLHTVSHGGRPGNIFAGFSGGFRLAKRIAGEGGSTPPKPVLLAHAVRIEGDGPGPVRENPGDPDVLRQNVQKLKIHAVIVGGICDRLEIPTTA